MFKIRYEWEDKLFDNLNDKNKRMNTSKKRAKIINDIYELLINESEIYIVYYIDVLLLKTLIIIHLLLIQR